jgi:hypothetical protein
VKNPASNRKAAARAANKVAVARSPASKVVSRIPGRADSSKVAAAGINPANRASSPGKAANRAASRSLASANCYVIRILLPGFEPGIFLLPRSWGEGLFKREQAVFGFDFDSRCFSCPTLGVARH